MYFFIIRKYLRFDRDQPFITLSALLAFLGIAIGVMVLIVAMSVMNGLDRDFKHRLLVMNTPLTIKAHRYFRVDDNTIKNLRNNFKDMKFSGYIYANVVARYAGRIEPGVMYGIELSEEKKINSILARDVKLKKLDNFNVVVGSTLLKSMELYSGKKSSLIYTFLNSSPTGFGSSLVAKRFHIASNYSSGLSGYDKSIAFVNLDSLRKILNYPSNYYNGIHVYTKHPKTDYKLLQNYLGRGYYAIGWWQKNGNIFYALSLEKRVMMIILMLIVLVAGINIISSTLMTVMHRRKEISLMLSLGMSKKDVKNIFFYLGVIIGSGGIIMGIILGFLGMYILGNFDIITLPKDVYGTTHVPIDFHFLDFCYIIFGALVIVFLASYYPAKKASNTDILKVLRED